MDSAKLAFDYYRTHRFAIFFFLGVLGFVLRKNSWNLLKCDRTLRDLAGEAKVNCHGVTYSIDLSHPYHSNSSLGFCL